MCFYQSKDYFKDYIIRTFFFILWLKMKYIVLDIGCYGLFCFFSSTDQELKVSYQKKTFEKKIEKTTFKTETYMIASGSKMEPTYEMTIL